MASPEAAVKSRRQALHRTLRRLLLNAFRRRPLGRKPVSWKGHLPLTQKQWKEAFDSRSGRLVRSDKIIERIRFGGVEAGIRAEVWLFLLSFYDTESTEEERELRKELKRAEYDELRKRCSFLKHAKGDLDREDSLNDAFCKDESQSPVAGEFANWQRIIRLDAVRMSPEWVRHSPSQGAITNGMARQLASDVRLTEYEHLEPCIQHHAARLVAILEVYALYDPESGYCQGMSDLLSPFVALLDEDDQAFWCFANFMSTARNNFREDEMGINRQLQLVSHILKKTDLQLWRHLEKIEASNCLFAYRMVVVLMRRELSFEQAVALWEILWADKISARAGKVKEFCQKRRKNAPPCEDLLLFVVVAAVRQVRKIIMADCTCLDDVLNVSNGMAGNLDVRVLLIEARELLLSIHAKLDI